ncbi:hypothetical protein V6N13_030894 [Hibiscus sabdariffa]
MSCHSYGSSNTQPLISVVNQRLVTAGKPIGDPLTRSEEFVNIGFLVFFFVTLWTSLRDVMFQDNQNQEKLYWDIKMSMELHVNMARGFSTLKLLELKGVLSDLITVPHFSSSIALDVLSSLSKMEFKHFMISSDNLLGCQVWQFSSDTSVFDGMSQLAPRICSLGGKKKVHYI